MGSRAIIGLALGAIVVVGLTGCQGTINGGYTRVQAKSDVASWSAEAESAVSSPTPTTAIKADGYITCRTDNGLFPTSFEWRTITDVSVPLADQPKATRAIVGAFSNDDWAAHEASGISTLTGPTGEKRKGAITVQTAGPTALSVSVVSACYQ